MRIAWLQPNLHYTGGARVAVELGQRLAKRNHRVSILIPRGRSKITIPPEVEVIECGLRQEHPLVALFAGLMGMATALPRVDIILASTPPLAMVAFLLTRARRIRGINYLLGDDVHLFDDGVYLKPAGLRILYRTVARAALRMGPVIVNSHWTAVRSLNEGGSRPLAIVPSGFNPEVFFPNTIPAKAGKSSNSVIPAQAGIQNESLSLNSREPSPYKDSRTYYHLVTVTRHLPAKGLPDLISGLNLIDQSQYPFQLKIISQDQLDLAKAGFPWHIVKPANDQELAENYRWGEIFVHTSWMEGFGLPPLEAQACGLAVVATDSGGVREYLRDEENALIISPREPASIARAVVRLMTDDNLRQNLIKRGLETCQDFTWDKAADKMERFLLDFTTG